ncbi:MAG: ABC-type transport auxiliary lipoprotein family protein [Wenzhouxiangellaceae bacterium]
MNTRTFTTALLLALCQACGFLPESEPIQLLDPQPGAGTPASQTHDWVLNIARPESDRMRDSTRVLVRGRDGQLRVYGNTRWVAAAPDLLRTLLVRDIRDRALLAEVRSASGGGQRMLALDLRRFELAETANGLAVDLRVEARLYDSRTARLLGSRLFDADLPVDSSEPAAIGRAFERALARLVGELGDWAVETGQASETEAAVR